jgi:uncharacterized protein (TIGR02145 family)
VTPASTSTAADGAIDLTVEGGKSPMAYTWSNGATTQDINNLTAGGYTVTVLSDDGQTVTDSATVTVVASTGSCTDYDGNTYTTVQIGTQLWMAENFEGLHTAGGGALTGVYAYDDNESNVASYGRLYTWEAAMSAGPTGWHLPSKAEWDILVNAVGSNPVEKLLDGGSSGFNVKLGGNVRAGEYNYLGTFGAFWTCTPTDDATHACRRLFDPNLSNILDDNTPVDIGLSVRYIKD